MGPKTLWLNDERTDGLTVIRDLGGPKINNRCHNRYRRINNIHNYLQHYCIRYYNNSTRHVWIKEFVYMSVSFNPKLSMSNANKLLFFIAHRIASYIMSYHLLFYAIILIILYIIIVRSQGLKLFVFGLIFIFVWFTYRINL